MTATTEYKPLERKFIELLRAADNENPLRLVQHRLKKIGFGNICLKCDGTGRYLHYGYCYRCNGTGSFTVRLTKALYAEVEEAVSAGKLDEYLEDIKRKQQLQRANDELFKLMNDNELSRDYSAIYDADRHGDSLKPIFKLRNEQTEKYDEYTKLERKLKSSSFKETIKKALADQYTKEALQKIQDEALLEKYEEVKAALIKINTEYEAFKKLFLTLFK